MELKWGTGRTELEMMSILRWSYKVCSYMKAITNC